MTSPIHDALDEQFRGHKVRVVANDGTEYVGFCERIHHHDRHVLLRDAVRVRDEPPVTDPAGTVYAAHCNTIEHFAAREEIVPVAVDDVVDAPYHVREFERDGNAGYIKQVRECGFVGSFPVVRRHGDRYQIVEGHKRFWVAREAGLEAHPARLIDCSEFELAERFVQDHLPPADKLADDGTSPNGYYDIDDCREALQALLIEWDGEILELERVKRLVDELDVGITGVTPDVE